MRPERPADIVATRAYRSKDGVGVNLEQESAANVGVFARPGRRTHAGVLRARRLRSGRSRRRARSPRHGTGTTGLNARSRDSGDPSGPPAGPAPPPRAGGPGPGRARRSRRTLAVPLFATAPRWTGRPAVAVRPCGTGLFRALWASFSAWAFACFALARGIAAARLALGLLLAPGVARASPLCGPPFSWPAWCGEEPGRGSRSPTPRAGVARRSPAARAAWTRTGRARRPRRSRARHCCPRSGPRERRGARVGAPNGRDNYAPQTLFRPCPSDATDLEHRGPPAAAPAAEQIDGRHREHSGDHHPPDDGRGRVSRQRLGVAAELAQLLLDVGQRHASRVISRQAATVASGGSSSPCLRSLHRPTPVSPRPGSRGAQEHEPSATHDHQAEDRSDRIGHPGPGSCEGRTGLGLQHAENAEQQEDGTDAEQGRRRPSEQQCPPYGPQRGDRLLNHVPPEKAEQLGSLLAWIGALAVTFSRHETAGYRADRPAASAETRPARRSVSFGGRDRRRRHTDRAGGRAVSRDVRGSRAARKNSRRCRRRRSSSTCPSGSVSSSASRNGTSLK